MGRRKIYKNIYKFYCILKQRKKESCPKIILKKKKLKIMSKPIVIDYSFKLFQDVKTINNYNGYKIKDVIVVGDYGFRIKVKIVITNHDFNFKSIVLIF